MTEMPSTPRSTAAQKWTVALLVVIAAAVCGVALLGWSFMTVFGKSIDAFGGSSAGQLTHQAACLTYSDFVLDQHHNGLSPEQIEGVIRHAGSTQVDDPAGFEDPDACGTPQEIIEVAQVGRP